MHIEHPGDRHSPPARRKISAKPPRALGLFEDRLRAGHHEQPNVRRDLPPVQDSGGLPQIADSRVRAAADEDHVHRPSPQHRPGLDAHVRARSLVLTPLGYRRIDRDGHPWIGPVRNHRRHRRGVDVQLSVEASILVAAQCAPARDARVPISPFRRARAAPEVFERLVVGRNHSRACAGLDRHVAEGHPLFHVERLDTWAVVFDDIPATDIHAPLPDNREREVFRRNPGPKAATDVNDHHPRLLLEQELRRQDVPHLRRADAEPERAEGSVRARMGISAHDRAPRKGEPQLRCDHVNDPVLARSRSEDTNSVLRAASDERFHHRVLRLGGGDAARPPRARWE